MINLITPDDSMDALLTTEANTAIAKGKELERVKTDYGKGKLKAYAKQQGIGPINANKLIGAYKFYLKYENLLYDFPLSTDALLELARFGDEHRQVQAIKEILKLGRHPDFEDVQKVVSRILGIEE